MKNEYSFMLCTSIKLFRPWELFKWSNQKFTSADMTWRMKIFFLILFPLLIMKRRTRDRLPKTTTTNKFCFWLKCSHQITSLLILLDCHSDLYFRNTIDRVILLKQFFQWTIKFRLMSLVVFNSVIDSFELCTSLLYLYPILIGALYTFL